MCIFQFDLWWYLEMIKKSPNMYVPKMRNLDNLSFIITLITNEFMIDLCLMKRIQEEQLY